MAKKLPKVGLLPPSLKKYYYNLLEFCEAFIVLMPLTTPQVLPTRKHFDWAAFLPSSQTGPHLYNACRDTVQHSLVNSHLTFFHMDESAMVEVIQKIVMKIVNPAVHLINFGNLMQSEGESTKDFLMRICSLAVD